VKCAANETIRSSIGAPEVVRHDVKHIRIILNVAKCYGNVNNKVNIVAILVAKAQFSTTTSSEEMFEI